jgi:hypothetical protein
MIDESLVARMQKGELSAYEEFANFIIQESMKTLPLVNENLIRRSATMHETSKKFYEENKDLVQHKKLVGEIMEQVEHENPGASFEKILSRVAGRSREVLKGTRTLGNAEPRRNRLSDLDDTIGEL